MTTATTTTDPRIAELERQRDRAVEHDLEHTERLTWEWQIWRETHEHAWSQRTRGLARRATALRREAASWRRTAAAFQEIAANLQAELDQLCAALHADVPLPTTWCPAPADDGSWQVTGAGPDGQYVAIRVEAAGATGAEDVAGAIAQALTVLTEPAAPTALRPRNRPQWIATRRCWEYVDVVYERGDDGALAEIRYLVDDPDDALEARLFDGDQVMLALARVGDGWQVTAAAHPIAAALEVGEPEFASPDVAADALELLTAAERGRLEKAIAASSRVIV